MAAERMSEARPDLSSPLGVLRSNADGKRRAAMVHRDDARRSLERAAAAEAEADTWQDAADKLAAAMGEAPT